MLVWCASRSLSVRVGIGAAEKLSETRICYGYDEINCLEISADDAPPFISPDSRAR
jgi:hypothetical protein